MVPFFPTRRSKQGPCSSATHCTFAALVSSIIPSCTLPSPFAALVLLHRTKLHSSVTFAALVLLVLLPLYQVALFCHLCGPRPPRPPPLYQVALFRHLCSPRPPSPLQPSSSSITFAALVLCHLCSPSPPSPLQPLSSSTIPSRTLPSPLQPSSSGASEAEYPPSSSNSQVKLSHFIAYLFCSPRPPAAPQRTTASISFPVCLSHMWHVYFSDQCLTVGCTLPTLPPAISVVLWRDATSALPTTSPHADDATAATFTHVDDAPIHLTTYLITWYARTSLVCICFHL